MKTLLIFSLLLLSSCTQEIMGMNRAQRFALYCTAATLAGQPEAGAALGTASGMLARIDAKAPRNVQPGGK